MNLRVLLLTLCHLAAVLFPAPAGEPVELILNSKQLEPTTTFELRFAAPMTTAEQIGQPAGESPLVIQPTLRGAFVWLSQRSGVFTPSEPIPLSTTLRMSLRSGLADTEGKPLPQWSHVVQTPPMELKGSHSPIYMPTQNARPEPQISLLFNADVQISEAGAFCKFIDAKGVEIAAKVEMADPAKNPKHQFPRWRSNDQSLLTWQPASTRSRVGTR
jgi:hypothetical protein